MAEADKPAKQQTQETTAAAGDIKVSETRPAEQKKSALTSFSDIEREVERAFERFFSRGWLPSLREFPSHLPMLKESFEGRMPKVDVIDKDEELVVEAELPGVRKSDIDVSLGDDSITIKASTYRKEEETEGEYQRREISRGLFSRTITLPGTVDPEKATASFEDGLLKVTLPKTDRSKRQSIPIS
ncbi:MAG: Hsp20/alpha crystallin family protein [Pseudomonadales bacterium]